VTGQKISSQRSALRIVSLYALFGIIWILLGDQLLTIVAPTAEAYRLLQSVKGGGSDPARIPLGDHLQAVLRQCSHAPILSVSLQNALNALLIRVDQAVPLGLVIHEMACDAVRGAEMRARWSEVPDAGSREQTVRLTLETPGHLQGSFSSQLLSACLDQVTGSVDNSDGQITLHVTLPVFGATRREADPRDRRRLSD
jgi:hypothetical protein